MYFVGSKPQACPPMCTLILLVSANVKVPRPVFPAKILAHDSSTVKPVQLTVPMPVTTTRLAFLFMLCSTDHVRFCGMIMSFNPGLALRPDFFFPDRHNFFQAIDAV